MQDVFPGIPSEVVEDIRDAMNRTGFGGASPLLCGRLRQARQRFVLSEVAKHNGEYFAYSGPAGVAGSPLADLGRSTSFKALLAAIYERGTGRRSMEANFLQVLRVLCGNHGLQYSNKFLYDAYVVTALVPIVIPSGRYHTRGDLVMFPNLRGVRSSALLNLSEKLLWQNPVTGWLLAKPAVQRRLGAPTIPMQRGNVYIFWCYRSLHANRPCPPDKVR